MLAVDGGILPRREGREPQPRPEAGGVDGVGRGLHPLRELGGVGLQPVAHPGLPAVVDLEEVAGAKPADAALQILPDAPGADVLVAVIPARVARDLLLRAGAHAERGKPVVKDPVLPAAGEKQVEGMEGAAAPESRAVPLHAQLAAGAVVPEQGIAGVLVERGDEAVILSLPEVAVAHTVGDALLLGVADEVIVAVAVEAVVPHHRFGQVPDAVGMRVAVILRRVGPALESVHEDAAGGAQRHAHRALHPDDRILRQLRHDMQRAVRDVAASEDGRVVFQRDLVVESVRHVSLLTLPKSPARPARSPRMTP